MSRARIIREFLALRPATRAEIAAAIGESGSKISGSLGEMVRSGHLVRTGEGHAGVYSLNRAPQFEWYRNAAERAAARKASVEKRRETIRAQARARYWAGREDAMAQRQAAREAAKAQKRAEQEAKAKVRAERIAARKAAIRAKQRAALKKHREAEDKRLAKHQAPPTKVAVQASRQMGVQVDERPAETVEQFLARGGQVERLSVTHPWTQPLVRTIRAANDAAYRARAA